jgi:hypothetical protein
MSSQRDQMRFDLEQQLAQAGTKVSSEEAFSLIAADFVEFGASGQVSSKAEIISAMSQWEPTERIIEDFSSRVKRFSLFGYIQGRQGNETQGGFSSFAQEFYMATQ